MKPAVYLTIPSIMLALIGQPQSWQLVSPGTDGAREMEFTLSIQSDGVAGCLLIYSSLDDAFEADTWHQTIEQAVDSAARLGIPPTSWIRSADADEPTSH